MPFVRVSVRKGRSPEQRTALATGIYEAMRGTFDVPDEDRFVVVDEYEPGDMVFSASYLGVERTDGLVIVQITANDTRTLAQKKALYAAIAEKLGRDPGVKPGDVFVNIVEVGKENWSFGDGIAQYA